MHYHTYRWQKHPQGLKLSLMRKKIKHITPKTGKLLYFLAH